MRETDRRRLWSVAAALGSLLSGCDRTEPTSPPSKPAPSPHREPQDAQPSAPDLYLATFSRPIFLEERGEGFNAAALEELFSRCRFNGALSLSLPDGRREAFAHGENASGISIDRNALFPIASISKTLTALTILRMIDRGEISIDTSLGELAPFFEREGISVSGDVVEVTVRHLLNHTSGFSGDIPLGVDPADRRAMLTAMLAETPRFAPGQRFAYSNRGYVVLAAVVEVCTGEPFEAAVSRLVLEPLGSTAITSYGALEISPDTVTLGKREGEAMLTEPLSWGRKGCTGFVASADDLAHLFEAISQRDFLSDESRHLLIDCPEWGYGAGVAVSELPSGEFVISHSGAERGAVYTYAVATTELPRASVIFSAGEKIPAPIQRAVGLGLLGEDLSLLPEPTLRRLEGRYLGAQGESLEAKLVTLPEGVAVLRFTSSSPMTAYHLNFGGASTAQARLCARIGDEVRDLLDTGTLSTLCSPYVAGKLTSLGLNPQTQNTWRTVGANLTPDRLAIECRVISSAGEQVSLILQRPPASGDYRIEAAGPSARIFRRDAPELATDIAVRDLFLTEAGRLYAFNGLTQCPEVMVVPTLGNDGSGAQLTIHAGSFVQTFARMGLESGLASDSPRDAD